MDPTYATYDPLRLAYLDNGLVTDLNEMADPIGQHIPIPPPVMRRRGMRGFGAYGQTDLPAVYEPELVATDQAPSWGGNILSSIGDALSNVIRTVGAQAPGMITGQPLPGQTYPGYYPPTTSPFGNISPIILIGGIVVVGYLLMRKR